MLTLLIVAIMPALCLGENIETNEISRSNDYYPVQTTADACPPPTVIGVCSLTCLEDMDCNVREKCCPTSCGGQVCTRSVTGRQFQQKPGKCPSKPSGFWVCSNRCSHDGDCKRSYKCCKNRCGALECIKPEMEEDSANALT